MFTSQRTDSVLRQVHSVHTLPIIFLSDPFQNINFPHLCPDLPWNVFLSGVPTKRLYTFVLCPMHATNTVRLIPAHLIALMSAEESKSLSFSLCIFLHTVLLLLTSQAQMLAFSITLIQCSSLSVRGTT